MKYLIKYTNVTDFARHINYMGFHDKNNMGVDTSARHCIVLQMSCQDHFFLHMLAVVTLPKYAVMRNNCVQYKTLLLIRTGTLPKLKVLRQLFCAFVNNLKALFNFITNGL